ncbi:LOW QUALITY PROTEIN: hypothetical protein ACHAW6_012801 [Cyclotella cf. meneghiniana]
MMLGEIDGNVILVKPMKKGGRERWVYLVLIGQLKSRGIRPKKHILDNEASDEFKQVIGKN